MERRTTIPIRVPPLIRLVSKNMFDENRFLRISAPMVRYSKLAFRTLVRLYDVDLAFTPMIVADSFKASLKARDSELTTCKILGEF